MVIQTAKELTAFGLLLSAFVIFPASPVAAGAMIFAACFTASRWDVDYGEVIECVIFLGAVAACVMAVFGWL